LQINIRQRAEPKHHTVIEISEQCVLDFNQPTCFLVEILPETNILFELSNMLVIFATWLVSATPTSLLMNTMS